MLRVQGPTNSKILIVGEAPSAADTRSGSYFQGAVGAVLDQLLREAGLNRYQVMLTTIARSTPPGENLGFFFEDKKFFKPTEYWQRCLGELAETISSLRPNIVIALGPVAMYYLTGNKGIGLFRGFITDCTLVPGVKVLPVTGLDVLMADYKMMFPAVMDFRKAVRNSTSPDFLVDRRELIINPTVSEIMDYCDFLVNEHRGPIALDIETVSGCHVDIIGLASSSQRAMSINFFRPNGLIREPRYDLNLEARLWAKLADVIETKELIMQNGNYDSAVLWLRNHIWCRHYTKDIMIAAHAVWPECPRSLNFLASVCLNVPPWKHTASENGDLYNAADAANTYGIWNVLEREMEKTGTRFTHDFEMAQSPVATMMQLQGFLIHREKQKELSEAYNKRAKELKDEITQLVGREINLNSPPQMSRLLYEEMALPKQYKRRKGKGENTLTTGADALAVLCRLSSHPVLKCIAEYKKVSKLLTFIDCPVSPDNRVHTCYNTTGANMAHEGKEGAVTDDDDAYRSFGRWSSSKSIIMPYGSGNLQNIPGEARKMYYAGDGKIIVQADYKQAEAVVVAFLIGDEKLKNLFRASFGLSEDECKKRNLDIHKITAATMSGYTVEFRETDDGLLVVFSQEVTADQRKVGKTIRHAKNYSAGPNVLANKLGIPLAAAKVLMSNYDAGNPELKQWQEKVIQYELRQTRTLTNLFGRKHKFLDRWGDDMFRSAYSFIPQSSVGDLLNTALIELYARYGSVIEIALQLHDAIYIIVDDTPEAVEFGKNALRECMIDAVQPLRTPAGEEFFIDIDFKTGYYWGDLD